MIKAIKAAQRLDSRGNPTVQVRITTDGGVFQAIVPSGASKGDYEAIELRDGDHSAYGGKGVQKAVHNVEHVLGPAIIKEQFDLREDHVLAKIDGLMIKLDGSKDKSHLGANAILGISMAAARAIAFAKGIPLFEFLRIESGASDNLTMPVPFFNVLNGGVHSGNTMAFQEFMLAPVGAKSITHAVQMGAEVYQELKKVVKNAFGGSAIGIGDEGGFAPPISEPHEALDLMTVAVENCGYSGKIKFAMDPASQEFFNEDKHVYDLGFKTSEPRIYPPAKLAELYHTLLEKYPIVLLEDPFGQDDWSSWASFNVDCPVELVGDDLLATNVERINIAANKKACNALLLKINQIGSITEALAAANKAYDLGWNVFVSHRSGETTDDFIADLVVGIGAGHLKTGSPCRGERVAKYNRLMDIEDEVNAAGRKFKYAGEGFGSLHTKSS